MRALALALVTAAAAAAHAQPATQPKRVPDKFTRAASDAFTAAAAADANGDLRTALGLYEKAHAISPHPSTIYNIADVQRRLAMLRDAIRSYETYLAMAPGAKDRREVEALIDQLARTPGRLVIYTTDASRRDSLDLAAGFVFVDGVLAKRPGPVPTQQPRNRPEIILEVPPGEHVVDIVTPLTYAMRECDVDPGGQRLCELEAEPRIDGNAVISASSRRLDVVFDRSGRDLIHRRIELTPGKHRLIVKDRGYGCQPLPLDVPAGANRLVYAFLGATEYDGLKRCRTLDIKHHRLQFDP